MTTTEVALFGHLVGVLAFVSGLVVAAVVFEAARRREAPAEISALLAVARFGVIFVLGGAVLLVVCGLWLVHLEHVGYGAGWIDWALGLFVLALVLGGAGGRAPRHARLAAARLASDGAPMNAELRGLLDDRLSLIANYAAAACVLAILVLMVFKP